MSTPSVSHLPPPTITAAAAACLARVRATVTVLSGVTADLEALEARVQALEAVAAAARITWPRSGAPEAAR